MKNNFSYDIIEKWHYVVKDGFPKDGVRCLVSRKLSVKDMEFLYYFSECPTPVTTDEGEILNTLKWEGPGWYTNTIDGVKASFESEIVAWLALVPHWITEDALLRQTDEEIRVHKC